MPWLTGRTARTPVFQPRSARSGQHWPPHLFAGGYERRPIDHDLTLKQAALAKGVSEELFDKVVNPLALTRPGSADIPSGQQKP